MKHPHHNLLRYLGYEITHDMTNNCLLWSLELKKDLPNKLVTFPDGRVGNITSISFTGNVNGKIISFNDTDAELYKKLKEHQRNSLIPEPL